MKENPRLILQAQQVVVCIAAMCSGVHGSCTAARAGWHMLLHGLEGTWPSRVLDLGVAKVPCT
jgi:hypothetical protein